MEQLRYQDGFRVLQGKREYVTYPEHSSFRMWFSDIPWHYESHFHSAIEVLLTVEGFVDYMVEDQSYHVGKDEVLILPPEKTHSLSMGENSSRLLFLFEPEPLMGMQDIRNTTTCVDQVFYLREGSEGHKEVRDLLLRTSEIYRGQDYLWNTLCYSCMLQIYGLLGRQYLTAVRAKRSQELTSGIEPEVITAAITYINTHYQENLSLEDVADFAGFSRYYFSRSFKKQTGRSIKDFLCQKRIQVASDLLTRTNKPMRDVAIESGFGSVATFNRVFREHKNCTPTQYRAIYGTY